MSISKRRAAGAPGRRGNEGGFGLVEVMISLLLVMVAAAAGVAVLGSSIQATSFANGIQSASRVGQDLIDRAMAEPFDSLTGTTSDPICNPSLGSTPIYVSPQGSSAGASTQYTRTCTVYNLTADFKAIRVVVAWTDSRDSRAHSVAMGMQRAR